MIGPWAAACLLLAAADGYMRHRAVSAGINITMAIVMLTLTWMLKRNAPRV